MADDAEGSRVVTEEQQCEQGDSKTIGAVVGPTTNDTVLVPPELTDHDKKNCNVYRELSALKKFLWESPEVDAFYARSKGISNSGNAAKSGSGSKGEAGGAGDQTQGYSGEDLNALRRHFRTFQNVLVEVDACTGVVKGAKVERFLDLCCAPGGFSDFICNSHERCSGVGMTLPASSGGRVQLFGCAEGFEVDAARYVCHFSDVIEVVRPIAMQECRDGGAATGEDGEESACSSPTVGTATTSHLPFELHSCDLVTAAGTYLTKGLEFAPERQLLKLCEIVLAFYALRNGGRMAMRLNNVERWFGANVLRVITGAFEYTEVVKPRCAHAKSSSTYVVGKGFLEDAAVSARRVLLKEVVHLLSFRDSDPTRQIVPSAAQLAFAEQPDLFDAFGAQLVHMATNAWGVQMGALRRLERSVFGRSRGGKMQHDSQWCQRRQRYADHDRGYRPNYRSFGGGSDRGGHWRGGGGGHWGGDGGGGGDRHWGGARGGDGRRWEGPGVRDGRWRGSSGEGRGYSPRSEHRYGGDRRADDRDRRYERYRREDGNRDDRGYRDDRDRRPRDHHRERR